VRFEFGSFLVAKLTDLLLDVVEHLEEVSYLRAIHADSAVLDNCFKYEGPPERPCMPLCILAQRQQVDLNGDRPVRLVELAGVDEGVIEDLLIQVGVQHDAVAVEQADSAF